jgi:hypothetical protein
MLTPEQKKFYEQNGYILLDGIFTEKDMKDCSDAYDELFERKKSEHSNLEAEWAGGWKNESNGNGSIENAKKSVSNFSNFNPYQNFCPISSQLRNCCYLIGLIHPQFTVSFCYLH